MSQFEYKVIPAPTKGQKAPGVKTNEARFALAVEAQMNALAAEGWAYLRSDLLPSEERQGLTSSQTIYRSVLVFYREIAAAPAELPEPGPAAAPEPPTVDTPAPAPITAERTPPPRVAVPINDVPDDPLNPK